MNGRKEVKQEGFREQRKKSAARLVFAAEYIGTRGRLVIYQ